MSKVVPLFGSKDDFKEPKKTLGQQVIDTHNKYAGQFTQEVGETTNEMGKKYMESLDKCVEMHQHLREPYYIHEILKMNSHLDCVVECKHIARLTQPLPEWGTSLYKVDNVKGDWIYLWGLPNEAEAQIFTSNPLGFEKKTVNDIFRFVKYLAELPKLIPQEELQKLSNSQIEKNKAADKLLAYWNSLFQFEGAP